MRSLIEQALDQEVNITIQKQPLCVALKQIEGQTGVKLSIRPEVADLLPYGERTPLVAEIKNTPLRRGLTDMLIHLGMTFRVRDRDVVIEPVDPLRRLARRASWGELRQLHHLLTTPCSPKTAASLSFCFRARSKEDQRQRLLAEAEKVAKGSLAEVLETVCSRMDCTWCPSNDSILVLSKAECVARLLEQPVMLRYRHAALDTVLADLARRAYLKLRVEPGVLKDLDPQSRENFTLMMGDATVRTGLEMISGITGLAYEATPNEIAIKRTPMIRAANKERGTTVRAGDPIVGKATFESKKGGSYSLFIYETDLSPQLSKWRERKIREAVRVMERSLKLE
jgi:hypothetical protein